MTAFPIGVVSNARVWTGSPAASISYVGGTSSGNNNVTYTFSNRSIGAEDANRIVAVIVFASAVAGDFTSVTIGGVEATKAVSVNNGNNMAMGIYYRSIPTGTTANIVVTCSDEAGRCAVSVYRIIKGYSADSLYTSSIQNAASTDLSEIVGGVSIYGTYRSTSTAYAVSRDTVSLTPDVSSVFSGTALVKFGNYSLTGNANASDTGTYAVDFNDGIIIGAHWR